MGDGRTLRFYEDSWYKLNPLETEEGMCCAKNSIEESWVFVVGYPNREHVRSKMVGQMGSIQFQENPYGYCWTYACLVETLVLIF